MIDGDTPDDFLDLTFGDEAEDTGEGQDLNVQDMADGTESPVVDLSGSAPTTVPVTAPSGQQTPSSVPTQQQTPGTPPPGQPAAATSPAPQPGQQPPAQEQAGPTDTQQTVDIEQFVTANADAIIGNLAKSHFSIDAQTAENLGFTPEIKDWIEKRDAKNYLLSMVQMNKALQSTLPAVVANLVQLTSRAKEAEAGFFNEFPELQGKVTGEQLRQIGQTLRSINPNLPRAQFQTLWGQTAMQLLGITKAQPAANAQHNGGRTVRRGQPQPFMPAGAVQPQRNMGGQNAPVLSGIEAINAAMKMDID